MAVHRDRDDMLIDRSTLVGAVEVVRRIPDQHRLFVETREEAIRTHGITGNTLDSLLDLGLPCRRHDGKMRFDHGDLAGISLRLGLNSPRRRALTYLATTIDRVAATGGNYTVDVLGRCPEIGHAGPCNFVASRRLLRPVDGISVAFIAPNHAQVSFSLTGTTPRHLPDIPSIHNLIHSLDDVEFHTLPESVAGDLGFLRETRLADCRLAVNFLEELGPRLGVAVRASYGLIVSSPVSIGHWWVEIDVGGRWIRADPFFLAALVKWDLLEESNWPVDRVPPDIYWLLDRERISFFKHSGGRVHASLMTRKRSASGAYAYRPK